MTVPQNKRILQNANFSAIPSSMQAISFRDRSGVTRHRRSWYTIHAARCKKRIRIRSSTEERCDPR